MKTEPHNIEYLVKDPGEIIFLRRTLEKLPIEIPFPTTIVLEPNRRRGELFPCLMVMYLDKELDRVGRKEYDNLKQKYNSDEPFQEVIVCSDGADRSLLLDKIKPTDESCKIIKNESPDGVMVVYGNGKSQASVHLTFWQGAYTSSDF